MPTGVAFTMASKNSRPQGSPLDGGSRLTARASASGLRHAPCRDANSGTGLRERERHGARRASRSHDQHAAAAQGHAPFKDRSTPT